MIVITRNGGKSDVILESIIDLNVPLLPPHVNFEQVVNYSKALIKGDPEQAGIIKKIFQDALAKVTSYDNN